MITVKHHTLGTKKYVQRRKLMLLRHDIYIPWHLYQGLIKCRQWASVTFSYLLKRFFFFLLKRKIYETKGPQSLTSLQSDAYRKNSIVSDANHAWSPMCYEHVTFLSFKLTSLLQRKRKARKRFSLLSSPQILSSLILKVGIKPRSFFGEMHQITQPLLWAGGSDLILSPNHP